MPVLYTILGIILFIVILVSIKVSVIIDYGEQTFVTLQYLFIKIPLVDPTKEKKPKKEKKQKKTKGKKETETVAQTTDAATSATEDKQNTTVTADATSDESATLTTESDKKNQPKEKKQGNSLIKQLYVDQGYEGLEKMLRGVGNGLGGFFGKLYKTFTIDELYITMVTAGSDAADTAIKHGRLCAWLYPILGKVVSTCKVKKYDFDISPDFLATKSSAKAYVKLHAVPIKVTNGAVVLAVQLAFKVLFKVLFAKKKSDKSKKVATQTATEVVETVAEGANKQSNY